VYCSKSQAIVQLVGNNEVFFLSPKYESRESTAIPPGNMGISAALKMISMFLWHPLPLESCVMGWKIR